MSTDTPRTDAQSVILGSIRGGAASHVGIPVDFARALERELAAAKAENDSLRRAYVRPDDLREQLDAKTAALERAETKVNHLEKDRHDLFSALEGVVHSGTSFAFARGQDVLEAVTARAASPEEGAK